MLFLLRAMRLWNLYRCHVESQFEKDNLVVCLDDSEEVEVAVEPEDRSHKRATAQENMNEVRTLEKRVVSFKKRTKGSKKKKKDHLNLLNLCHTMRLLRPMSRSSLMTTLCWKLISLKHF